MAMSRAQKLAKILRRRNKYERLWLSELRRWMDGFLLEYTPGTKLIPEGQEAAFKALSTRVIMGQASESLGFNLMDFKQEDDVNALLNLIRANITYETTPLVSAQINRITAGMMSESVKFMVRTNEITEIGSPPAVYRTTLKNYLYNHRLTVAVSNTTFVDEAVRRVAVKVVADPLQNSVLQLVDLIEAGDNNAAVKLSRQIKKLVNLPLSATQEEMINVAVTPLNQASALANIRADAERLGAQQKRWETMGDGDVRPSHVSAGAQDPVGVDDPFIVGGSLMQYPMDGSLGAPLSEIMGCRCVTDYT